MTTGYWDKTTERHSLTVLEAEIPNEPHRANAKVWSVLAPPRDSGKNLSPRPSQILGCPLLPHAVSALLSPCLLPPIPAKPPLPSSNKDPWDDSQRQPKLSKTSSLPQDPELHHIHRAPSAIVSPPHSNLQGANIQRCDVRSISGRCDQRAARPPSPVLSILQPCRLPPLLPPWVGNSSSRSPDASPCAGCCAYGCTAKIKTAFLIFCFLMYYLCEKDYKPITVQDYILIVLVGYQG